MGDKEFESDLTSLFYAAADTRDGKNFLYRIADISLGTIRPYVRDYSIPASFANRPRLPEETTFGHGTIACFRWRTERNLKDPEKDFVDHNYLDEIPLTVVGVSDTFLSMSASQVAQKLGERVPEKRAQQHAILYRCLRGEGVLCTPADLVVDGTTVKLSPNVFTLPVYSIKESDVVKLTAPGNVALKYYRQSEGFKSGPMRLVPTIDRGTMVRRYIRDNYLGVGQLKSRPGITREIAKTVKGVFEQIRPGINIDSMAEAIGCSKDEAQKELDQILKDIDSLTKPSELDKEFVKNVILNGGELVAYFQKTWEEEAGDEIDELKKKYGEELERLKKENSAELERLKIEHGKATKEVLDGKFNAERELESLRKSVASERKELDELESKVSNGKTVLESIRKEAGALLKDVGGSFGKVMTYAAVLNILPKPVETTERGCDERRRVVQDDQIFFSGAEIDKGRMVEDVFMAVCDNLSLAGVDASVENKLGAYLLGAYRSRTPLILAGYSGRAIADALSSAVCGRFADTMHCRGEVDRGAIESALSGDSGVVAVVGGINSGWTDEILIRLEGCKKHVVFLCPVADDLALMPKGLFDYALPLKTDVLASGMASLGTETAIGSLWTGPFEKVDGARLKMGQMFRKIGISQVCCNRCAQAMALAGKHLGNMSGHDECLLVLFPYAFGTGKLGLLAELMNTAGMNIPRIEGLLPKEED